MATVTPNFNWPVPTSTDLVKDGATAIEALGDSIDASMVDLKGGTTGQVLSKASNTDMDFSWVAQDDSNAIQNSIVDAKGDLIAASANDTPARLAVGSNGETLVADSSTSTGLRYQGTIAAGRNFCINGGMDIWQRGTTFTATANLTYLADRWFNSTGTSLTVTRDTDVPTSPYFTYSMKSVGSSDNSVSMRIESANSTLLAGQTVTFSFYAKRTSGAGALDVRFYYPSATDNFASVTQIGSTVVVSASPSSSWTRYSVTAAIGTNITTGLQILINNTGASTTFMTGAQLEIGSVATQFSRSGGTIQGELAACCYYYERLVSDATYTAFGAGFYTTGSRLFVNVPYQRKRVAPLLAFSNVAGWWGSGSLGAATIATSYIGKTSAGLDVSVSGGSTSTGFGGILSSNNNTAGYIELNSEL